MNAKPLHATDDFEEDIRRMLHRRAGDIASPGQPIEPGIGEPTAIYPVGPSEESEVFDGSDSSYPLTADTRRSPRWLAVAAAILLVGTVGGLAALNGVGNETPAVISADPTGSINDGSISDGRIDDSNGGKSTSPSSTSMTDQPKGNCDCRVELPDTSTTLTATENNGSTSTTTNTTQPATTEAGNTKTPQPATSEGGPTPQGVVFETNFANDTGYEASSLTLWNGGGKVNHPTPWGWDGLRVSNNGSFSIDPNAGIGNTNALKIDYHQQSSGRSTATLAKHLTGDPTAGFDELYIRYNIKLPNNFKAGADGKGLPFWKWGRLWQNSDISPSGNWTENRVDSGFAIWGLYSSLRGRQAFNATWAENVDPTLPGLTKGSNGGPSHFAAWRNPGDNPPQNDGYFEHMDNGAWEINYTDRPGFLQNNTNQSYHTVEWRFKLASSAEAADGIFEMWFDGVKQDQYDKSESFGGAPSRNGLATVALDSGFNHFSFFDNMQSWSVDWNDENVDGHIFVNDVVVSTDPIGHTYVAGNTDTAN